MVKLAIVATVVAALCLTPAAQANVPPATAGQCQQFMWGMFDKKPGPGAKHPVKLRRGYTTCAHNRALTGNAKRCFDAFAITGLGTTVGGIIGLASARSIAAAVGGGGAASCIAALR